MKILYISKALLPSPVSNSLSIMKMCQALADQGHDVTLAVLAKRGFDNKSQEQIFQYYGLEKKFSIKIILFLKVFNFFRMQDFVYAFKLRKILTHEKLDIIYSRLCLVPNMAVSGEIPFIYEMHSPGPIEKSFIQRKLFEKVILSKKHLRIVVTTELLKRYLLERYPNLDIKVARLSAEEPIEISGEEIEEFKKKNIPESSNNFKVGFTGFLDNRGLRGGELICEIARRMEHVDFHIVGGPENVIKYYSTHADSKNITNLYFHGRKSSNLIPFFLKSFNIVIAPLQFQKDKKRPLGRGISPLKISQYLAYGCAIIASDIRAHAEILTDNKNALLAKADSIEDWICKIELLRGDEILCKRIRQNAEVLYKNGFMPFQRVNKILQGFPK